MTFDAHKKKIGELFGSDASLQLRVPYYQRGYSWTKEQIEPFLSDLGAFAEKRSDSRPSEYFLGPIVLMRGPAFKKYDFVIDGQQRIATSQVLLASIRDRAHEYGMEQPEGLEFAQLVHDTVFCSKGPGGGARPSLRLGDLDQGYFHEAIQRYPRHVDRNTRNAEEKRIQTARNMADQWLTRSLEDSSVPLDYLRSLYRSLLHHTVVVAIDVENDRQAMDVFERINFRGAELAEPDLILHRLMRACKSRADRQDLRNIWNKIVNLVGDTISLQVFMRHMWSARLGDVRATKLYDLVEQHLDSNSVSSGDFLYETLEFCREYVALLSGQSPELHFQSRDAVTAVSKVLGVKDALPLLLGCQHRLKRSPEFSRVAKAVEALIVRHQVFAGRDQSELREVLLAACQDVWGPGSKGDVSERVVARLKTVDPKRGEMCAGIKKERKVSAKVARYILRGIQNHMVNDAYKATATLEHIFPRKPSQGYSSSRRRLLTPYLNHLGNLTLLTGNDNKRASNRPFGEKKKRVYVDAELEIARDVATYDQWGLSSLLRRAEALAKTASNRWKIL